jgi:hypothetical protein
VIVEGTEHVGVNSTLCPQTQAARVVVLANPRAILDLQTVTRWLTSPVNGTALDQCGYETFVDFRGLVTDITGFEVEPHTVPVAGLATDEVHQRTVELALDFFGRVL